MFDGAFLLREECRSLSNIKLFFFQYEHTLTFLESIEYILVTVNYNRVFLLSSVKRGFNVLKTLFIASSFNIVYTVPNVLLILFQRLCYFSFFIFFCLYVFFQNFLFSLSRYWLHKILLCCILDLIYFPGTNIEFDAILLNGTVLQLFITYISKQILQDTFSLLVA